MAIDSNDRIKHNLFRNRAEMSIAMHGLRDFVFCAVIFGLRRHLLRWSDLFVGGGGGGSMVVSSDDGALGDYCNGSMQRRLDPNATATATANAN